MLKSDHLIIRARALAVLGTGSDVGKSLMAAALCRVLHRAGKRVAPFKAQNMSLNSFVTPEGGEMGRAQVLQAQACGLVPQVDMNPILLKPEGDNQSQVIVMGKVWNRQKAHEYFGQKEELFKLVQAGYERLARQHEVIIIEGAGSAAEINLRDRDIVNWPVVEMADAGVILVADIDRGGVFAQVIGTMDLLRPDERRRIIGVVINKFRGDARFFNDGVRIIEARTGVPILGVVPYLKHLVIDQEDSVEIDRHREAPFSSTMINIAVLLVPHMSNFTDFNQLAEESDVILRYAAHPQDCRGADVVILPGSKTTSSDLAHLKQQGFQPFLTAFIEQGGEVIGICGGYQMLGKKICDPWNVEQGGVEEGFGLLDIVTTLCREKSTVWVKARPVGMPWASDCMVEGYEIHMGVTTGGSHQPVFWILPAERGEEGQGDGARGREGLVWGTYIHGVFDRPEFRRAWLNQLRHKKGLSSLPVENSVQVSTRLSGELDRWADHVAAHIDLRPVFIFLEEGKT